VAGYYSATQQHERRRSTGRLSHRRLHFLETNWKFVKAVRVGETITASVTVEHVRDDKPICRLETVVRDSAGQPCVVGTAVTYTMPLLTARGEQLS
jgi:acyl dehydratase